VIINLLDSLVQPDPPSIIPKLTIDDFKIKNNYYVVTDGKVFNYYSIKVEPASESALFFRFEKAPPVILEGIAIINKKVYKVPLQDLLRRIVRKSREVDLRKEDGKQETSIGTSDSISADEVIDTPVAGAKTVQRKNERGADREAEVEVGKAADSAWKDQVRALLVTLSEEEGEDWEIEDLT
jgi:hypothetical protein